MAKQYQLYGRLHECEQWSYLGTVAEPETAWRGMQIARARGCAVRVVTTQQVQVDQDVLHG